MQSDDEERGNAAQAFEDLCAEVSVLRRAVEALPGEWEANQPPDYTESLGQITQGLAAVADRLQVIEQHPALTQTPAQHQAALAAAGQELMSRAAGQLTLATAACTRTQQTLVDLIGTARSQRRQREWLAIAASTALLFGLLLSPFAARRLPFGWDASVAATILNSDRWQAGQILLQSADPAAWSTLSAAADLVRVNHVALSACRMAAQRTKSEQRCSIAVPAP